MQTTGEIRSKVIAALKGFIKTCRLEPARRKAQCEGYLETFRWFNSSEGEMFDLLVKQKEREVILGLIDRLYPSQTDWKLVDRFLMDTATEWIEQGEILSNVVDCLSSGGDPRGYGSDGARRLKPITHGHPIVELGSRSYQGHQMRSADFAPMPLGR